MIAPLLIEIGCEEIPARMIGQASRDLATRVIALLDQAGLAHGPAESWGGPRRLAVRVGEVASRLTDRQETVLGPPVSAAFGPDGKPTAAGAGFARKQGIDPRALERIETDKGSYAGFTRRITGRTVEEVVAAALPQAVAGMSFPKSMRWGSGEHRWVRPVHAVVALHGEQTLDLAILGVRSGRDSFGHRFLAPGPVPITHADRYLETLKGAKVLGDPLVRRSELETALAAAARRAGGTLVPDEALLDEVKDLVEWPGVVVGRFDDVFLDLPREILVTTLRHHQKSFSVQGPAGLLPAFLSVAGTDRDPAGHVRRGNEWVVVGRLTDARFFWNEDRGRPLGSRLDDLKSISFHVKVGSYDDKTATTARLTERLAAAVGLDAESRRRASLAARLAKADLSTGLVGEFPELQGIVGGLLLLAEGENEEIARAVYEHYRPAGASDAIPSTDIACVVAAADRLDTTGALLGAGETPTGSRDPFGLRRALGGVFRIAIERRWPVGLETVAALLDRPGDAASTARVRSFAVERFQSYLRDQGFTQNEINAVLQAAIGTSASAERVLFELCDRLEVVKTLRERDDFRRLVELTKRVDNILQKQRELAEAAIASGWKPGTFIETAPSSTALQAAHASLGASIAGASSAGRFAEVVDLVARYVEPVAKFFDDVLVLDPADPDATAWRCTLLDGVRATVTRDFDIRELAGQADARR